MTFKVQSQKNRLPSAVVAIENNSEYFLPNADAATITK